MAENERQMSVSAPDTVSGKSPYQPVSEHDFVSVTLLEQMPPVIRQSPHLLRYLDAVRAGYSTRQLERMAERSFGEKISRERFRELQQVIPMADRLPQSYRQTVLRDIDADLDVVQDLQNLIAVQQVRVTEAMRFETGLRKTDDCGGTIPLKTTSEEIRLLHLMLKDYANMEITLGLLNKGWALPTVAGNGVMLDVEPMEAEVIALREKLTDEAYDRLLMVCDEIEASLSGWTVQLDESITLSEAVAVSVC